MNMTQTSSIQVMCALSCIFLIKNTIHELQKL